MSFIAIPGLIKKQVSYTGSLFSMVRWFLIIAVLTVLGCEYGFGQTTTVASGAWNTSANWSAGVPSGGNAIVNHPMTVNADLHPSSGTYAVNAPLTDVTGGTAYDMLITNSGKMDINANVTLEGVLTISQSGSLIVRSGDTLIIGYPGSTATSTFSNTSTIVVEAGAVLIINGNLDADNASGTTVDGELIINGNYTSENGASVAGTGTMNTTGTIVSSNSSTVFGSKNDCSSGPCSGNNLCATNTIGSAQTICNGSSPAQLTGNNPGSAFTYAWQQSTTSSTGGFADLAGANAQNYSPAPLTSTAWFRRRVSDGSCTATSVAVQVTVNPYVAASVSIAASPSTTVCSGASVTFTATPVNGGGAPSYQWKKNGVNVGTNSAAFTTSTLSNGDMIACVMTSSAQCVTGSPATSNTLAMTVLTGAVVWTGTTSTDWFTASNWCGSVPVSTSDVVIGSGTANMPVIASTGATCRNLTVNTGATLTIAGSNTLSVKGNVANSGTLAGTGTAVLNGTAAQTVTGTGVFKNITLNNASGATLSGAVTVSGVLTLTAGTLASNGNLTVDLTTGQISGAGSGSVSGNVTFKRSVSSAGYHYISSPIPGKTVADWNDNVTISTGSQYRNLYYYDETIADPDNEIGWTAITSLSAPLASMKGYALYYNSAATMDVTGTYTHAAVPANVTLTNTVSSDVTSDGWNLIGNPYPSTLDWDAASGWTKTNINNAIYFWDPVNNRYASYVAGVGTNGGTRYIPAMQAFWVKTSTSGVAGTLGMNNNVRTSAATPSIWKTGMSTNILKFSLTKESLTDETIIRFREDATEAFDGRLDAFKLKNDGNTPSLFTKTAGEEFAINSLPELTENYSVELFVEARVPGEYSLHAGQISTFDPAYIILLEDKKQHTFQDLKAQPVYVFQVAAGDSTGRFVVHIKRAADTVETPSENASVTIRGFEQTVYVGFPSGSGAATVVICNTMGREIFRRENIETNSGGFQTRFDAVSSGIYIVKVQTAAGTAAAKVYLSN